MQYNRISVVFSQQVNELKQTVSESAEIIASLRKTTIIMLGIIVFLQLVLTYQVISFNSGTVSTENSDQLSLHENTRPEGNEEL